MKLKILFRLLINRLAENFFFFSMVELEFQECKQILLIQFQSLNIRKEPISISEVSTHTHTHKLILFCFIGLFAFERKSKPLNETERQRTIVIRKNGTIKSYSPAGTTL